MSDVPPTAGKREHFIQHGLRGRHDLFHYWAQAPLLVVLVLLTVYPVLQLLRIAFSEVSYTGNQAAWQFVGLKHLHEMLADPVIPAAGLNTLYFVLIVVPVETFLGLALAIVASKTRRGSRLYRTLLMLPALLPGVAVGAIWRLMYDYNMGLIDQVLALLHISGPTWLADPHLALPAIMIVDVWHWTAFLFLIFLAGVEGLPAETSEAARVDGANEFQIIMHIWLPALWPTILTGVLLRLIDAVRVFEEIYLMTSGGPGTSTQVASLYIYQVYFTQFRTGYGGFLALMLALILSIFVVFYLMMNNRQLREANR